VNKVEKQDAKVAMRRGELWHESERALVVCHRVIKFALRAKGIDQIEMRFGKIGQSALIADHGLFACALLAQNVGQIVMCFSKLRLERYRAVKVPPSLRRSPA